MPGKVYIMGVGPGDYKLITLKAKECIEKADVIVYDRLISSRIIKLAKENTEFIYVGKMPDCHAVPQEGINEILVKKAMEGKTVARVKGGDPFMFGRGGEEAQALVDNGIEFEIIPGVTSAISVPAYAGIPVTHRDFSSSLHIITGHEKPGKESSFIDYEVVSKLEGTLVFLMGVKNLSDICNNLIKYGKDKETPAAVVENGTTPFQRKVLGTLETISQKVIEEGIKSPAVTVIGDVVRLEEKLDWYPKGALSGKRVIVTRSREQASILAECICDLGGEVIEFPTVKIEEIQDYSEVDRALLNLQSYTYLVFTSVNGVKYFIKRLKEKKIDIRNLFGIKLCAVGEATAQALNEHGLLVDFMPDKFTTKALLEGLLERIQPREKVLLARSDIADEDLTKGLKDKGIEFDNVVIYRTTLESPEKENVLELLKAGKIDFITFTSSSTVKNFVSIIGKDIEHAINTKCVCIGPVTYDTAVKSGFKDIVMADSYTIQGIMDRLRLG